MRDTFSYSASADQQARTEEAVRGICADYGLDAKYCYRVDIELDEVKFWLYRGREGRCKGAKFVDQGTGEAACEIVKFVRD